jgi:hypothetical protein
VIRFLTILTGRNLPIIKQPRETEPSIINEKTDFTRVVEQTGIWSANAGPIRMDQDSGRGSSSR